MRIGKKKLKQLLYWNKDSRSYEQMKKLLNAKELNWLTVLYTILSVLMLTGCSLLSVQEQVNPIQANLLEKCPELSKHEGTTGKDVLYTLTNWASEYNECATRHNQLVDVVNGQGKRQ